MKIGRPKEGASMQGLMFNGYRRPDASVGFLNHVSIIPTDNISNFVKSRLQVKPVSATSVSPIFWVTPHIAGLASESERRVGLAAIEKVRSLMRAKE